MNFLFYFIILLFSFFFLKPGIKKKNYLFVMLLGQKDPVCCFDKDNCFSIAVEDFQSYLGEDTFSAMEKSRKKINGMFFVNPSNKDAMSLSLMTGKMFDNASLNEKSLYKQVQVIKCNQIFVIWEDKFFCINNPKLKEEFNNFYKKPCAEIIINDQNIVTECIREKKTLRNLGNFSEDHNFSTAPVGENRFLDQATRPNPITSMSKLLEKNESVVTLAPIRDSGLEQTKPSSHRYDNSGLDIGDQLGRNVEENNEEIDIKSVNRDTINDLKNLNLITKQDLISQEIPFTGQSSHRHDKSGFDIVNELDQNLSYNYRAPRRGLGVENDNKTQVETKNSATIAIPAAQVSDSLPTNQVSRNLPFQIILDTNVLNAQTNLTSSTAQDSSTMSLTNNSSLNKTMATQAPTTYLSLTTIQKKTNQNTLGPTPTKNITLQRSTQGETVPKTTFITRKLTSQTSTSIGDYGFTTVTPTGVTNQEFNSSLQTKQTTAASSQRPTTIREKKITQTTNSAGQSSTPTPINTRPTNMPTQKPTTSTSKNNFSIKTIVPTTVEPLKINSPFQIFFDNNQTTIVPTTSYSSQTSQQIDQTINVSETTQSTTISPTTSYSSQTSQQIDQTNNVSETTQSTTMSPTTGYSSQTSQQIDETINVSPTQTPTIVPTTTYSSQASQQIDETINASPTQKPTIVPTTTMSPTTIYSSQTSQQIDQTINVSETTQSTTMSPTTSYSSQTPQQIDETINVSPTQTQTTHISTTIAPKITLQSTPLEFSFDPNSTKLPINIPPLIDSQFVDQKLNRVIIPSTQKPNNTTGKKPNQTTNISTQLSTAPNINTIQSTTIGIEIPTMFTSTSSPTQNNAPFQIIIQTSAPTVTTTPTPTEPTTAPNINTIQSTTIGIEKPTMFTSTSSPTQNNAPFQIIIQTSSPSVTTTPTPTEPTSTSVPTESTTSSPTDTVPSTSDQTTRTRIPSTQAPVTTKKRQNQPTTTATEIPTTFTSTSSTTTVLPTTKPRLDTGPAFQIIIENSPPTVTTTPMPTEQTTTNSPTYEQTTETTPAPTKVGSTTPAPTTQITPNPTVSTQQKSTESSTKKTFSLFKPKKTKTPPSTTTMTPNKSTTNFGAQYQSGCTMVKVEQKNTPASICPADKPFCPNNLMVFDQGQLVACRKSNLSQIPLDFLSLEQCEPGHVLVTTNEGLFCGNVNVIFGSEKTNNIIYDQMVFPDSNKETLSSFFGLQKILGADDSIKAWDSIKSVQNIYISPFDPNQLLRGCNLNGDSVSPVCESGYMCQNSFAIHDGETERFFCFSDCLLNGTSCPKKTKYIEDINTVSLNDMLYIQSFSFPGSAISSYNQTDNLFLSCEEISINNGFVSCTNAKNISPLVFYFFAANCFIILIKLFHFFLNTFDFQNLSNITALYLIQKEKFTQILNKNNPTRFEAFLKKKILEKPKTFAPLTKNELFLQLPLYELQNLKQQNLQENEVQSQEQEQNLSEKEITTKIIRAGKVILSKHKNISVTFSLFLEKIGPNLYMFLYFVLLLADSLETWKSFPSSTPEKPEFYHTAMNMFLISSIFLWAFQQNNFDSYVLIFLNMVYNGFLIYYF